MKRKTTLFTSGRKKAKEKFETYPSGIELGSSASVDSKCDALSTIPLRRLE